MNLCRREYFFVSNLIKRRKEKKDNNNKNTTQQPFLLDSHYEVGGNAGQDESEGSVVQADSDVNSNISRMPMQDATG